MIQYKVELEAKGFEMIVPDVYFIGTELLDRIVSHYGDVLVQVEATPVDGYGNYVGPTRSTFGTVYAADVESNVAQYARIIQEAKAKALLIAV